MTDAAKEKITKMIEAFEKVAKEHNAIEAFEKAAKEHNAYLVGEKKLTEIVLKQLKEIDNGEVH